VKQFQPTVTLITAQGLVDPISKADREVVFPVVSGGLVLTTAVGYCPDLRRVDESAEMAIELDIPLRIGVKVAFQDGSPAVGMGVVIEGAEYTRGELKVQGLAGLSLDNPGSICRAMSEGACTLEGVRAGINLLAVGRSEAAVESGEVSFPGVAESQEVVIAFRTSHRLRATSGPEISIAGSELRRTARQPARLFSIVVAQIEDCASLRGRVRGGLSQGARGTAIIRYERHLDDVPHGANQTVNDIEREVDLQQDGSFVFQNVMPGRKELTIRWGNVAPLAGLSFYGAEVVLLPYESKDLGDIVQSGRGLRFMAECVDREGRVIPADGIVDVKVSGVAQGYTVLESFPVNVGRPVCLAGLPASLVTISGTSDRVKVEGGFAIRERVLERMLAAGNSDPSVTLQFHVTSKRRVRVHLVDMESAAGGAPNVSEIWQNGKHSECDSVRGSDGQWIQASQYDEDGGMVVLHCWSDSGATGLFVRQALTIASEDATAGWRVAAAIRGHFMGARETWPMRAVFRPEGQDGPAVHAVLNGNGEFVLKGCVPLVKYVCDAAGHEASVVAGAAGTTVEAGGI
jgi:hypothetical protein